MAVFRLFGKIISANKIGEAVSTRAWLIHQDRIFYPFFPGYSGTRCSCATMAGLWTYKINKNK